MANLTKEQREAKEKAKLESEVPESITEKIETNIAVAKESGTLKKVVKKIDDETMVAVASFKGGKTQFKNEIEPYDFYVWEQFGDVQDVRFGSLRDLRRRSGEEPFKKMLYVLDEEAITELGLAKIYAEVGSLEEMITLFEKPLAVVLKFVENASPQVKEVLRQIMYNKLERKEPVDLFTAKTLAEKLNIELNLDL